MNDDTKKQKTFPINKFVALFDCMAGDYTLSSNEKFIISLHLYILYREADN